MTAVPVISEFLASNNSVLDDEDGDDSDWIELHNAGDTDMSLNRWYLTDDANNLRKWRFPEVNLGAGEYLIVFASGKDRDITGQEPLQLAHVRERLLGLGRPLRRHVIAVEEAVVMVESRNKRKPPL